MTRRALSDEEEEEAVVRYLAGLSTLRLAEVFGTSDTSIRRLLERRGVPRRPRSVKRRRGVGSPGS